MKKVFLIAIIALMAACSGGNFEQVDYFKNDQKTRIYLVATPDADSTALYEYGESMMYTPGAITEVYFYHNKADIYPISARTDLQEIYEVLSQSNFFAKYNKNPVGNSYLKMFK